MSNGKRPFSGPPAGGSTSKPDGSKDGARKGGRARDHHAASRRKPTPGSLAERKVTTVDDLWLLRLTASAVELRSWQDAVKTVLVKDYPKSAFCIENGRYDNVAAATHSALFDQTFRRMSGGVSYLDAFNGRFPQQAAVPAPALPTPATVGSSAAVSSTAPVTRRTTASASATPASASATPALVVPAAPPSTSGLPPAASPAAPAAAPAAAQSIAAAAVIQSVVANSIAPTAALAPVAANAAGVLPPHVAYMFDNHLAAAVRSAEDATSGLLKRQREIEDGYAPMQAVIWGCLSMASRERIKMHPLWISIASLRDPLALWEAIALTHTQFDSGDDIHDANTAWRQYYDLRQDIQQGLPQHKEAFDAALREVQARAPLQTHPLPAAVVEKFISSLDSSRFGDLQLTYRNKLMPYPPSLEDAYHVAATWCVSMRQGLRGRAVAGGQQTAFPICSAATAFVSKEAPTHGPHKISNDPKGTKAKKGSKRVPPNPSPKAQPRSLGSGAPSRERTCNACKDPSHFIGDCPHFKAYLASRKASSAATSLAITASSSADDPPFEDDVFSHYLTKFGATALPAVSFKSLNRDDGEYASEAELSPGEVALAAQQLPETAVLLDNQATKGIFGNRNLLSRVKRADTFTTFSGVGGSLKTNLVGFFEPLGMWVHYCPKFSYNVLSFSQVLDHSCRISYDGSSNKWFKVTTTSGSRERSFFFSRQDCGLWSCDFGREVSLLAPEEVSLSSLSYLDETCTECTDGVSGTDADTPETVAVQTVKENEAMYPKREVQAAKKARELSKLLGYPSPADLQLMLRRGIINNAPVTAQDVQRADRIYGPEVPSIKGKSKAARPTAIKTVPLPKYVVSELVMLCDVMFVEGDPYLTSVTKPLGLLVVTDLVSRSTDHVRDALNRQLREYMAREFVITVIWTDREGAVMHLKSDLMANGIKVEPVGANRHVPGIEVRIRVIKERCRAILNSLPFLLPRSLLRYLVMYVVSRINLVPSDAVRTDGVSPREAFLGRRADYNIDCRIAFGECVQIPTEIQPTNSMGPRTELAIALGPKDSASGLVMFWVWRSKRVVLRSNWTATLPFSETLIAAINELALAEGKLVGKLPKFRVGNHEIVDIPGNIVKDPNRPVGDRLPVERLIRDTSRVDVEGFHDVLVPPPAKDIRSVTELDPTSVPADGTGWKDGGPRDSGVPNAPPPPDGAIVPGDEIAPPINSPVADYLSPLERAALNSASPDRSLNRVYVVTEHDHGPRPEICLQISVKKAIETWGNHAEKAIKSEISQMVKMGVFHGVHMHTLTSKDRSNSILCHMFLKEKRDADGVFEKLKARLVAGGDRQDRSLYESTSSPTASLTAVLIVAAIAAKMKMVVKSSDVTAAYLNAPMGKVTVHMRIRGKLAEWLVHIAPEFAEFVNADGSIIVKLDRAMYGCIESAKLWYELLVSTLVDEYGMTVNPYDNCVLNKTTESGHLLTVVVYVDDTLVTCADESEVDGVIRFLRKKFTTISVHDGPVLSYLGMSLDFSVAGQVNVTMPGYVNDLLDNLGVQGTVTTPATSDVFELPKDGEKGSHLVPKEDATSFHTIVAKLLYLAKRARPDILVAVTFLTSRVQAPTVSDNAKLYRVLKYLNGTRDLGICLVQDFWFPVAYCDASYGVHHDGKSHTGLFITLGSGPIYVGSAKQKIVVKSSTEAELVALSDSLGQIVWTREFMRIQAGVSADDAFPPAVVMEDNMSTIALLKSARTFTQRTKHISIRYFVMRDRMQLGEIIVCHMNTEDMIADILTKGLQGAQFVYLREKLLNRS